MDDNEITEWQQKFDVFIAGGKSALEKNIRKAIVIGFSYGRFSTFEDLLAAYDTGRLDFQLPDADNGKEESDDRHTESDNPGDDVSTDGPSNKSA